MIEVRKGARRVVAMTLNEPVNGVLGIIQCVVNGCEAHRVMMAEDLVGDVVPGQIVKDFLDTHDCDPTRYPGRTTHRILEFPTADADRRHPSVRRHRRHR